MIVVNDYELELLKQKTGLDESALLDRSEALVVTRGADGSSVFTRGRRADIPAVQPERIVDPTGVGDAYRGGLMKGIAIGLSCEDAARVASVAAAYALEHLGGQGHAYTWDEFKRRYERQFGPLVAT